VRLIGQLPAPCIGRVRAVSDCVATGCAAPRSSLGRCNRCHASHRARGVPSYARGRQAHHRNHGCGLNLDTHSGQTMLVGCDGPHACMGHHGASPCGAPCVMCMGAAMDLHACCTCMHASPMCRLTPPNRTTHACRRHRPRGLPPDRQTRCEGLHGARADEESADRQGQAAVCGRALCWASRLGEGDGGRVRCREPRGRGDCYTVSKKWAGAPAHAGCNWGGCCLAVARCMHAHLKRARAWRACARASAMGLLAWAGSGRRVLAYHAALADPRPAPCVHSQHTLTHARARARSLARARWNPQLKQEIKSSRINVTNRVVVRARRRRCCSLSDAIVYCTCACAR
jgi:hypothetical protein